MLKEVTMLIADDEDSIRNGLCKVIEWNSIGVKIAGVAATGGKALEMIIRLKPDIVITDIRMPDKSGLEMIEDARSSGLNEIYFIILSGYDDFGYAQCAIQNHVFSYLLKPINPTELMDAVKRAREEIITRRDMGCKHQQRDLTAKRNKKVLREKFYDMLSREGYHSEWEIDNAINSMNIQPISCPCVVVAFRFTLPYKKDTSGFSKEDNVLFRSALVNVVTELAQSREVVFFGNENNNIEMVMEQTDNIYEFLETCINSMREISPIKLTAGIGSIAGSLFEVEQSSRSAREIVEYHMYNSDKMIFDSAVLKEYEGKMPGPPPDMGSISEAVMDNDADRINAEMETFLSSLFYIPMPPPAYVRGMCSYALYGIEKNIPLPLLQSTDITVDKWAREIESFETFGDLEIYLKKILLLFAKVLNKSKANFIPQIIEQSKRFIRDNLKGKIKLEQIAASVHLSESYFTVMFKKYTGVTVRDYILECKLQKAKELLLGDEMTVSEVADWLGYGDYRSFSRAFKRFSGFSPTEYRHMLYLGKGME